MNRLFNIMIVVLSMSSLVFAKSFAPGLGLNAGFSVPVAEFAKNDGSDDAGFAQFGFAGTVEFDLFFCDCESRFGWSTSFNYIVNDYQTDATLDWIPDFELEDTGTYSNYSLLTGVKYARDLSDSFTAFAYGQVGLNFAKGPFFGGIVTDAFDNMVAVDVQMDNSTTQGFSVGFGFIANRTTTVSLRYFSLGSATFSGSSTYTLNDAQYDVSHEWTQPISTILLTVGYTINFE